MAQMNMIEMLKAGVGPNGVMLNTGSVDGVGGGMNPLLAANGQTTVGGGTYVPFGGANTGAATKLAQTLPGATQAQQQQTFETTKYDGVPKTITMRGDLMQPIGAYGGTPEAGSSKANWLAGIGTGSSPVTTTPNTASGGLAGQQQQTSYVRKLADIVKAPKRQAIGETNQADIPQQ